MRADYDFVLIDLPAGIERGFRNAIAAADRVLVVTNPEVSAVRDADRVIGILEAEEKGPAALIINRLNPNLVKKHDMLSADDVLDLLAVELIGVVPEDENVIIGSNRGAPVAYDTKSKAGTGFPKYCSTFARRDRSISGSGESGEFMGTSTAAGGEEVR